MTDWIVDKELIPIFDRLSETIEFRGAYILDEFNERLKQKQRAFDYRAKNKILSTYLSTKKAKHSKENLQKLIDADFGAHVIAYARRHPDGIVNLTLHVGKENAIKILLERSRRLRGKLRIVKPDLRRRF